MIEARTNEENATPKAITPETITTSMIIEDLENGIDRPGIKEKYGLETWEIAQMFKHPALKGKKARKVRKMSFNFVDDTPAVDPNQISIPDGGFTQTNISDSGNIDGSIPTEAEFTADEINQMEGEAYESKLLHTGSDHDIEGNPNFNV